jgi:hypothetical protein
MQYRLVDDNNNHAEEAEDFAEETEPVWSFYLILLFASMYMSMLLTDWGTKTVSDEIVDHSATASMWVKIVAQWVTVGLFAWTLVAPAILTDREF